MRHATRIGSLVAGTAGAAALLVSVAEVSNRWASESKLPATGPGEAATEAIIVLGYASRRDGTPHPLQRWRCQIAVRSMNPGRESTLIMSGWSAGGQRSEAEVMAAYAHDVLAVPRDRIVLEERARSTWENVRFSLPLAEGHDVIKVASNPVHARRARRYIAHLRPDLVARLEPAADYRLGEHWLLKTAVFGYEVLRPFARRTRLSGWR